MVEFKIVLSDPKNGQSHKVDVSGGAAAFLMGKHVGDEVDATSLGIAGYRIKITGASDRNVLLQSRTSRLRDGENCCSQAV